MVFTKPRYLLVFLALAALCAGCGSKLAVPTQKLDAPSTGSALVTFFRPTALGGGAEFNLWDRTEYMGTVFGRQFFQAEVAAGEHLFVVQGQNNAYIEASLEAGKKYYVLLNVSMGFMSAVAIPVPLKQDNEKYGKNEINEWLANLKPVSPEPEAADKFQQGRQAQIESIVEKGEAPDAKHYFLSAEDYWD